MLLLSGRELPARTVTDVIDRYTAVVHQAEVDRTLMRLKTTANTEHAEPAGADIGC